MNLELERHCYGPEATLGVLRVGDLELFTLERTWIPDPEHGSRPNESCVPDGTYLLVPHSGRKYRDTWALVAPEHLVTHQQDGPGRFGIVLHAGNVARDTDGCVLPGMSRGYDTSGSMPQPAVWDSRTAMDKLRDALSVEREHLLIISPTTGARHDPGRQAP